MAARRLNWQRNRATPASLPAPTGGWNARDSIAAMEPTDAVAMINFFPSTTDVILRFGYSNHATGIFGQVETLMAYSGAATEEMFAIASGSVYDVTSSGAVGAADLSGLTNSRWQYINIATPGGNFIEMCNGVDGVYTYNGTTWTNQSASITGVTAANLIHINMHKNRVWFVENNALSAWYLPVQSITGAAAELDLSAYCPHGGYLMAMGTWTIDAGYGVDDLAVFVTNQGDVAVFRGTDPSSATTWALVGIWYIGSPIGRRCLEKHGGELLIITQDGVQSMTSALQSSRVKPQSAITDKIQQQMAAAVTNYGSNFGWELSHFPNQNMLILNVPVSAGSGQEQYVMNTITGAWCDFQGWDANTFCLFNDELYFGGNQIVGQAWDTNQDAGVDIEAQVLQAFNYFGNPGQLKRFTLMRPTFLVNGSIEVMGNINADFDTSAPGSALSIASISGGIWDAGLWDTALWAADLSLSRLWQGTSGLGYCGAPRIQVVGDGRQLQWLSTEVVMEAGGIL